MGSLIAAAVLGTQFLVPVTMADAGGTPHELASRTVKLTLAQRVARVPFSIRLEDQFLAALHYLPLEVKQPSASVVTTTSTTTTTSTVPTSSTTSSTTTTTVATSTTTSRGDHKAIR